MPNPFTSPMIRMGTWTPSAPVAGPHGSSSPLLPIRKKKATVRTNYVPKPSGSSSGSKGPESKGSGSGSRYVAPKKPAVKKAVIAKPAVAPAAVAPKAPDYLAWARQYYANLRAQTEQDLRNRFAAQGILSSSAAIGEQNRAQMEIGAKEAAMATEMQKYNDAMQEAEFQRAAKVYELAMSGALGQAAYDTSVRYPSQPAIFGKVYNNAFLAPRASAYGPMGDAGEAIPMVDWDAGSRMRAGQAFDAQQAALARSFQAAEASTARDWQEQQTAAEKAATIANPWGLAGQAAAQNRQLAVTKQGGLLPTQFIANLRSGSVGDTALDVYGEIQNGGPHAIEAEGIIRTLYSPASADIIIARLKGQTPTTPSPSEATSTAPTVWGRKMPTPGQPKATLFGGPGTESMILNWLAKQGNNSPVSFLYNKFHS